MPAIKSSGSLIITTSNKILSDIDAKTLQLEPDHYVFLGVADNGCGMGSETKEKFFEPFYTTKGEKGTGLGLTQVYGFIERSDGTIQVYSEVGQGTKFVIYFPAHEDAADVNVERSDVEENYRGYESILLVDDESALLELTCKILNDQDYRTICTPNAKQAIELLKSESFDLLITDIIMTDMNGYQLAALVKKEYPQIKIQLASGFSDDRHADMVDDDLHKKIIQKPYQSHELLKTVRDIFDKT